MSRDAWGRGAFQQPAFIAAMYGLANCMFSPGLCIAVLRVSEPFYQIAPSSSARLST